MPQNTASRKLQKFCSDAATDFWKQFKEDYRKIYSQQETDDLELDYKNHYSRPLNKCLVECMVRPHVASVK